VKPSRVLRTAVLVAWLVAGCRSPGNQGPDASPLPDGAVLVDAPLGIDARPDGAPDGAPIDGRPPGDGGERLRLVAGNITSGNFQAYELPGIRIFRGLAPDVAMIQEFNFEGNTDTDLREFVDQAFGAGYVFFRGTGQIPNGIVSRYPILTSGEWVDTEVSNRRFVWAQIDIPGSIDLFAISVHLLTSNQTERDSEARQLVQNISALPGGMYITLAGDFNTDVRTEPCIQTLAPLFVTAAPYPADQQGVEGTNAGRAKPYDWVLASSTLDALETDVVIGGNRFDDGLVVDTRVYSPITDLAPALATDSGASMMQHMAVVRDFQLPVVSVPTVRVVAPNGGETWAAGSRQTVRWTANAVDSVVVELTTDGVQFTALAGATPATAGQVEVTVPAMATTTARVRVAAASGTPSDTSDAAFTISIGSPPMGRVFLNEVLANEPGSNPVGEFVELVNTSGSDVDISGWTISDSLAVRHTFAAGSTLAAGRAIAVFGATAGIPPGLGNAIAASTGELNLGNSGDTVTLAAPAAAIDSMTYTSAGTDGVSLNRNPDGDPVGVFVPHTLLVPTTARSPGTRADGTAF
jgi:endonuclease/exonuclease/phosphatase family metal-dependent hydrolase